MNRDLSVFTCRGFYRPTCLACCKDRTGSNQRTTAGGSSAATARKKTLTLTCAAPPFCGPGRKPRRRRNNHHDPLGNPLLTPDRCHAGGQTDVARRGSHLLHPSRYVLLQPERQYLPGHTECP